MTLPCKVIAVICASLALGLSALMTTGLIGPHTPVLGCNGEVACEAVIGSRWSLIAGLPVSLLGSVGYFAVLAGLFALEKLQATPAVPVVWNLLAVAGCIGLGFILWLTFLQWAIIRYFCIYCLTAHGVGALAFLLVLRGAPIWHDRRNVLVRVTTPATASLAVLIALHVLMPPDMIAVQAAEELTLGQPASTVASGGVQFGKREPQRTVTFLDRNLTFDLYKVPVLGDREAPRVLVELFDYNCPACRKVGRLMLQFKQEQKGQVAVILFPVPMETDCNPTIKGTLPMFTDSCFYARLALAVFRAAPDRFAEFHAWMLNGDFSPSPDKARAYAEELADKAALDKALDDPEIDQWIANGIGIFQYIQATTLPRIIAGDQVISSAGLAREKLFRSLRDGLGLSD